MGPGDLRRIPSADQRLQGLGLKLTRGCSWAVRGSDLDLLMGNEESTQATKNHTYSRTKVIICVLPHSFGYQSGLSFVFISSTSTDICGPFYKLPWSEVAYIKLIIDFLSGKHRGKHKRKCYPSNKSLYSWWLSFWQAVVLEEGFRSHITYLHSCFVFLLSKKQTVLV